jgi:hypothetical protein
MQNLTRITLAIMTLIIVAMAPVTSKAADDFYTENEILNAARGFFGETSGGLAAVVEKIFGELGKPNGYILGEEVGGAFIVGLRYGNGELNIKGGPKRTVYWQGPSIGFDFGGNIAKSMTLVYGIQEADDIYKRYPGVSGSFYFVAGVGVNYQQNGDVILVPMRTGMGLRAGANAGYLHYGREHSWIPF